MEVVATLPLRERIDSNEVAELCRANPGKWVKVGVRHMSYVTNLRRGRYPGLPPDEFEFAARATDEEGERIARPYAWIYARAR